MTDLKVVSRSTFEVSFKVSVIFRKLVAYFPRAMTMSRGSLLHLRGQRILPRTHSIVKSVIGKQQLQDGNFRQINLA